MNEIRKFFFDNFPQEEEKDNFTNRKNPLDCFKMAAVIGQQVISLASNTVKMASAVLTVQDSAFCWTQPKELKTYTLDEVAWHWEPNDCWMVIYDKVYDLTDFLSEHPGGYDVLLEHAGRDGTIAFRGVGHSKQGLVAMDKYCIGVLVKEERIYLRNESES